MLAICDVNEYRKCVKEFKIEVVEKLFDALHSLCNLLVVVPENLKQVSSGDQLVSHVISAVSSGDQLVSHVISDVSSGDQLVSHVISVVSSGEQLVSHVISAVSSGD